MRCYLLAVRCLRTKCCLLLLIICIILIIGRVFHHKRAAFFRSILGRSSNDYDFFRPFFSNFSKNHQFVPGQFLNNYVPQNFSFCKFRFGLPYNLEYENDDVRYPPELREESDYRVVYNVLESSYPLNASTNVTYCTHATPEFVFYLVEILHRWQGPVSIATFVPSTDASLVICILNRLCRCLPDMSRVSLHFVFPQKYPPQLTDCPLSLVMPYDCSTPYAVLKKSIHTFRSSELLTYPVNVARNVARRQTMTTFVLVSDVELFPSKNLVKNFIKMVANLQKKSGVGLEECINKLVYVLPVFEVQHYEVIPDIKSKLLQLYGQSQAFYFHRWVCSHCQRFPGLQRWLLRKSLILDNKIEASRFLTEIKYLISVLFNFYHYDTSLLQPFFVVRREFPFHRWEPVFIGTNADPLYSEMLSWEGQQDKMTQMHEMCLLRYRFVILDGAFLVHSPGVKRKADITKDSWRLEQQRLNNFHYDNIITSITARQKHNTRCKISKGHRRKREDKETPKTEEDETNITDEITPEEISEEFSTVDLPTNEEVETIKVSRSDQLMDHQKRSNVANVFSNDSKDSEITIYTLDREMGRIKKDEHFHNSEPRTKIKANLYHEPEAMASHDGHSVASQASPYPPYRLNFLPPDDWKESDTNLQVISKLLFSECSLACFLIFWLISTALLFYLTEGPFEYELLENLKILENSTMVSMATDLRILEPDWDETLIKYMEVHKQQILSAVRNGYKNENIIWTFPGSLLSAISIIATLGLAAPLPVTSEGKIGAMIFTSFGLPIHFIFIIHLGRTIAVRLQLFAKVTENKVADLRERIDNVRRFGEDRKRETWPEKMFIVDFVPPPWLCYFPILSYLFYYIIGFLIFGLARNLPMSEMFVFFVDFSQGHESNGFSRMGYCWYLEGFAILTGINIAILRDSPMTGFTSIALSHGLLTNSID